MAEQATSGVSAPRFVRDGARELGAEMRAERWLSIGDEERDHFLWMHPPTRKVVTMGGPHPRKTETFSCLGVPTVRGEPADPTTTGYIVESYTSDEHGNPEAGRCVWVESFGEALKWARGIRAAILAEAPALPEDGRQLTFDDLLRGSR